ncbi:MAG TPA: hypothetical protein VFL91_32720 [Thermomicrobiales bacterium]|nr:hypothetical protein [Thermomicrobiales bacterium]
MALLAIQHPVRDYQAWRSVYDSVGELQRKLGVTAESVHQQAGNPNTVLVLHHFATTAQAEAFLTNPEIQAAMRRAGVAGQPRVEVYA